MRLETSMSQRMIQGQFLAPRMIQSMDIMKLPIMAFQEKIEQELQENPVLELKETNPEEQPAPEDGEEALEPVLEETVDPGDKELIIDENNGNELDFDRLEAMSKDWEDHFNEEHRRSRNGMDEKGDKSHHANQDIAARPKTLPQYIE